MHYLIPFIFLLISSCEDNVEESNNTNQLLFIACEGNFGSSDGSIEVFREQEKIQTVVEHAHSYLMEVSNHLPGTLDRSALLFWTPFSWGTGAECFERLNTLIEVENLGFGSIFSDGERILFICPESITRAKVVKILNDLGLEKLSENLKQREHYWVRISGIMDDDGIWHNEPKFISIIDNNNSKSIYSRAHLTLLTKLGIPIDSSQYEKLAGKSEPSIRMVVRD